MTGSTQKTIPDTVYQQIAYTLHKILTKYKPQHGSGMLRPCMSRPRLHRQTDAYKGLYVAAACHP